MILRCRKGGVGNTTPLPTSKFVKPVEKKKEADEDPLAPRDDDDKKQSGMLSARDYLPRIPTENPEWEGTGRAPGSKAEWEDRGLRQRTKQFRQPTVKLDEDRFVGFTAASPA